MALNTAHFQPLRNSIVLTLALVALLIGLWPHGVMAQSSGQQVLEAINAARAENGLPPLAENSLLDQAAQNHVDDMLTNYVYGHYGSDGSTVQIRVARTGYSATPWVSENWVSALDPSGAMRWWMNDYIHRVNILTGNWREVGVGVGSRGGEMIFVTVFSAGGGSGENSVPIAAGTPPIEAPPPPSVHIEQVTVPAEGLDYTVQSGDTLLDIGLRYGLPWERIAGFNSLTERSLLQIGQSIRIPGSGAPAVPKPAVKTEEYIVQANDTLWSIAAQRDMYWDDVAGVNDFNEQTVLQIGQVIQVPVVEKEPEPTLLVNMRHDGQGPLPSDESANSFGSYTLMQFDPNAQLANAPMAMVSAGIGGPLDEAQVVAMAKSQNIGATAQIIAQHQGQVESEPVVADASASVPATTVAETIASDVAASDVAAVATTEAATTEAAVSEVAQIPAPIDVIATDSPSVEALAAGAATDDGAEVASVASAAMAEGSESPTLYEVQPGDTIISIAAQFDVAWGPLLLLNDLTESSVLQLGQVIRLR